MDADMKIVPLSQAQVEDVVQRLELYDYERFPLPRRGQVRLGIEKDGTLIAGVDAQMTSFRIMYVSSLFVDEAYRRQGLGRTLMEALEEEARELGANMIRLDSFDWQGPQFYRSLGYEQVGGYSSEADGFSEFFFLKRLS